MCSPHIQDGACLSCLSSISVWFVQERSSRGALSDLEAAETAARVELDFGARVRDARQRAAMTQRQLGDAIGVDASAISRIEQGSRAVRLGEAALIAEALKLTLGELVTFNDDALAQLNSARADLENATSRLRTARDIAVDSVDRVRSVLERPDFHESVPYTSVDVSNIISMCSLVITLFDDHDHTYWMRKITSELVEIDQPHVNIGTDDDSEA